jgi:hypothetical protein
MKGDLFDACLWEGSLTQPASGRALKNICKSFKCCPSLCVCIVVVMTRACEGCVIHTHLNKSTLEVHTGGAQAVVPVGVLNEEHLYLWFRGFSAHLL